MAPSSSICVSFFSDFDEDVIVAEDDCKLRNKRVDRAAMKQKHRKLAKIKECAYATSLDDIVFDSTKLDDVLCLTVVNDLDVKLDSKDDLDVMAHVELKVKDGLPLVISYSSFSR